MHHTMDIQTPTDIRSMSDFSSLKFIELYMSGDIPGSCKLYMLQLTDTAINMNSALDQCVMLINSNDSFFVLG